MKCLSVKMFGWTNRVNFPTCVPAPDLTERPGSYFPTNNWEDYEIHKKIRVPKKRQKVENPYPKSVPKKKKSKPKKQKREPSPEPEESEEDSFSSAESTSSEEEEKEVERKSVKCSEKKSHKSKRKSQHTANNEEGMEIEQNKIAYSEQAQQNNDSYELQF